VPPAGADPEFGKGVALCVKRLKTTKTEKKKERSRMSERSS